MRTIRRERTTHMSNDRLEGLLGMRGVPQALVEQSPLSTIIFDPDGRAVFTNTAFGGLWGASVSDVPAGYSVLSDPQFDAQGILPLVRRAFQGESVVTPPIRYDMTLATGSGRVVWTEGYFSPLNDAAGALRGVVLVHVDLTTRMHVIEALQHSEQRVRMALDAGRMGAWEWVLATGEVRWSEMLELIHGLEPGGFGGTFEQYGEDIHPADRGLVSRTIARTLDGEDHHLSYRIVRPDGAERWLEAHGSLIRNDDGTPQRLVGVCRDITEQHHADAAATFLIQASEVLASSLDYAITLSNVARLAVPMLADYCIIDLLESDGTVRRVATAHADPARDPLVARVRDFPPVLESDGIVARALRTGEPQITSPIRNVVMEASAAHRAAHQEILRELAPTSVLCVPLVVRGVTLGTILLAYAESGRAYNASDIPLVEELARRAAAAVNGADLFRATEQARAAAEQAARDAHAANRAKADFLAVMSHELRTPLNAIGGYAELLALGIHGPVTAEQTQDLGRIKRSQRHLLSLINDLLNYAKLEAGHVRYVLDDVSVGSVLTSLEPLVAPQFSARGLVYLSNPAAADLVTRADAEKLRQILLNLLSNAVKFTERGGKVEVSAARRDGGIYISVADTGAGIPPSKLEAIFEPFVQLSRDLTHNQEGTGLGLAISRDLARAMGGDLTAESTVGRGSTFTLVMPSA